MKLDHATIVTKDLEHARRILCGIVGLSDGPRPSFQVAGYWLYADGRPVIHLVEATLPALEVKACPRIDHIALRVDDAEEWTALIDRLRSNNVPYTLAEVPLADEIQLFVPLAPGVVLEFVTQANSFASTIVN
ncbi:glyoxalase family protein [Caballeronia choica]|uniref:Glyoxalase family protein n=1 Tax=Caballeronia choica TaxID=326476 RepID=A0A158FPU0_9BURK|nr:extradiol dioxygenase [Caballeronia choica]SAL21641.1 glyoxalase family protein [Caballeronia choica]